MIKNIAFIISILILSAACTEEIDVKLDSTYTRLVVDGYVQDSGNCRISLSTSAAYFSNTAAPRVVNAQVTLTDGINTIPLTETIPGISGIYEAVPGFTGVAGNTYSLRIETPQPIAGRTTFEASSKMNSVASLDSIATEFHPDWGPKGIWAVKIWAQEPGDEVNYYMFDLYRNGVLITDTIWKKTVTDDRFYNGSYMKGVDAIYLNDANAWETIRKGDRITVRMCGITREYYNFVNQVRQAGFSIPFFSGPPANVQGNIDNGAVGFFAAWSCSYCDGIVQ